MQTLTRDHLHRFAPSIFAATPYEKMSRRYRMVPTIEVVDMLQERGFRPVRAEQSRSRTPGKADFTRHMIRFRQEEQLDAAVRAEIPELVLSNSHDGTAAYRFEAGIFRVACLNGLVVRSAGIASISVRHSGGDDFFARILDATMSITEATPMVMGQIDAWKQIELSPPQREAFAAAAIELKPIEGIQPRQLLAPRRTDDRKADLWTTANIVQEHLLKGGIQGRKENGRRITTRPVKSVDGDLKLNRALWTLTERLAEIVS